MGPAALSRGMDEDSWEELFVIYFRIPGKAVGKGRPRFTKNGHTFTPDGTRNYEELVRATESKAVLYISHRLSSAVLADRIIVIEEGRILQQGSHSELMNSEGKYKEMFTLQASSYNRESEGDSNA